MCNVDHDDQSVPSTANKLSSLVSRASARKRQGQAMVFEAGDLLGDLNSLSVICSPI